jgi:5,10-methylenetetrahydromethanopterin reductase
MADNDPSVGLVLGGALPPEQIVESARLGEQLGFSELWVSERYFFTGGVSGAGAALAATERVPVGFSVVSAMVRHPAVLAMEVATLARMYPARVWPGIGLGVPAWVDQMGLMPRSPLGAIRECITSVRRLLDGETLDEKGVNFEFNEVRLTHPPPERTPLYIGALGPKMLRLSGEIADGTVGSGLATTAYIRWAREQIAAGAEAAGCDGHHRVAVLAVYAVDRDGTRAKESLRPIVAFSLAAVPKSALTDIYGIGDELAELAKGGPERIQREMPDQWLEDLVVAGEPDECAEKIAALLDAGADSVAIAPGQVERTLDVVRLTAREVLPRIS